MSENVQERINAYLEDTIAAERNFESTLRGFSETGVQQPVKDMFLGFAQKAKTQHERLAALLERRGGTPSGGKTILAQILSATPLSAQIGHGPEEKNTQHLMITFAAAAAEMAMYESLAETATQVGDDETYALATTLQAEERDDHRQVWELLRPSARSAFLDEIEDGKDAQRLLRGYLEDAIAAEKSFETQLQGFAKEGDDPAVQRLFSQHAIETKGQYESLTQRLEAIGGSPSITKSILAHFFALAPKTAQIGHDEIERTTQNLMMAYAVENAEVAMYESLAEVALAAGDTVTAQLVTSIQQQEKETAEKIWPEIGNSARRAITIALSRKAS